VSLLDEVHALLGDPDDTIRDRALRCLKALGRPESVEPLIAAARREEDEYLKVEIAEALLELGDPRGFAPMIDVIADGAAPAQARRDAWEHVRAHAILDVALHSDLPPEENDKAVADLRRWWAENGAKLVPRPSGIFEAR
jgi:HEAT repeat protein